MLDQQHIKLHKIYNNNGSVVYIYRNYSSLGIHLLHQYLFLCRLSSSTLSFIVQMIFRCTRRADARAFLCTLAFFEGSMSCTLLHRNNINRELPNIIFMHLCLEADLELLQLSFGETAILLRPGLGHQLNNPLGSLTVILLCGAEELQP